MERMSEQGLQSIVEGDIVTKEGSTKIFMPQIQGWQEHQTQALQETGGYPIHTRRSPGKQLLARIRPSRSMEESFALCSTIENQKIFACLHHGTYPRC